MSRNALVARSEASNNPEPAGVGRVFLNRRVSNLVPEHPIWADGDSIGCVFFLPIPALDYYLPAIALQAIINPVSATGIDAIFIHFKPPPDNRKNDRMIKWQIGFEQYSANTQELVRALVDVVRYHFTGDEFELEHRDAERFYDRVWAD